MLFSYFADAVLRGPTIGSMLMCLSAALIGCIVFLRKHSLIGEALSHASYPGVILGVVAAGLLSTNENNELLITSCITVAAFISAMGGIWMIHYLELKLKIKSDAAICFVLSAFFGIGVTLASEIQFSLTSLYRQSLVYLYGQAATMNDDDILIYALLALVSILVVILFYKEIQVITFNREFAQSLGIKARSIDALIFTLTALAIVIGIRSVGVVLMSAMLIAPATAARQYTHHLSIMFLLAGIFGIISGFMGNYLSVEYSNYLSKEYSGMRFTLPTGPMIVLVASGICFFSLLFAPQRGLFFRFFRITRFHYQCIQENILKAFWRRGENQTATFSQISTYQRIPHLYLKFLLFNLIKKKDLKKEREGYRLTEEGKKHAAQIVRLHRLWEVYLVDYLGMGAERVHRSAEEMEHIITPELEQELTLLLKDPKTDPHHQKIPPHEGSCTHELL